LGRTTAYRKYNASRPSRPGLDFPWRQVAGEMTAIGATTWHRCQATGEIGAIGATTWHRCQVTGEIGTIGATTWHRCQGTGEIGAIGATTWHGCQYTGEIGRQRARSCRSAATRPSGSAKTVPPRTTFHQSPPPSVAHLPHVPSGEAGQGWPASGARWPRGRRPSLPLRRLPGGDRLHSRRRVWPSPRCPGWIPTRTHHEIHTRGPVTRRTRCWVTVQNLRTSRPAPPRSGRCPGPRPRARSGRRTRPSDRARSPRTRTRA